MPTNQSSPWDGGDVRDLSTAGSPTTATKHPKATKVPLRPAFVQVPGGRSPARPLLSDSASPVPPSGPMSVPPPSSVWSYNRSNTRALPASVPQVSSNILQRLNASKKLSQVLATGGKQDKKKTEAKVALSAALNGAMQKYLSLPDAQPADRLKVSRLQDDSIEPLDWKPFLSVSPLLCKEKPSVRQRGNIMHDAGDHPSSPPVPPVGLKRGRSAKAATSVGPLVAGGPPLNPEFCLRGIPPPLVGVAASRRASRHPVGSLLGATEWKPPSLLEGASDVASSPAGVLVGSVTSQISTIHLTRPRGCPSTASSSPLSPCAPQTEESESGEAQLSGQECGMQVDGAEEEIPGELENICSDDDDSDGSSVTSIILKSGIEEPMLLGPEEDLEEKPALVPSLFPFVAPTLYFSTANEKVELLPVEQRRLLKWKMSTVTPNVVKRVIARSHFKATKKSHDWLGCWGHHMKSTCFKTIAEHQKLNHFPGTFQIGRKDRLWRNMSKMQVRFGKQEFSFIPRTFVLPQDIKLLRKAWDESARQKWIIKPPASARGLGIQVIHKWSQMPRKRPLLVQKYLHKPYLISGNKFDLRIYVYVTSYDPLRIYIYSDGLVRFASCKYSSSMKTLSNKFMHLTNYSVNKKNSEYQANSDDKACQGHKWALKALWQYLGERGVNTALIWEKIKDIVVKTIITSEPYVFSLLNMNVRTAYSCHELFGFDIMLDEKLKPWLLEVNISPSLHSNSALDVAVKGHMVRDLLNLAGFRIPSREEVFSRCSSVCSSTSSLLGGSREKSKPEVTPDEKVKRTFYVSQRFSEQDFLSTVLDVLTPEDVRVLVESEDELCRRGRFERAFPSPASSRYLRFFECPRYKNLLLDQWEQKHWSDRSKGVSLLTALCQKGVHLGTSDPAHMWSKCSYVSKFEPHRPDNISLSRSRVVVSHRRLSYHSDGASDEEVASLLSVPASCSSLASSACGSPSPSLLPRHFATL